MTVQKRKREKLQNGVAKIRIYLVGHVCSFLEDVSVCPLQETTQGRLGGLLLQARSGGGTTTHSIHALDPEWYPKKPILFDTLCRANSMTTAAHPGSRLPQLDYDSPRSLSNQIVEHYRGLITNQILKAGTRLPTCLEIGKQIGLAPQTVNRAFDILAQEKLVYRRRSVGTIVGHPKSEKSRSGEFSSPSSTRIRQTSRMPVRIVISPIVDRDVDLLIADYLNGLIEGFNVQRCKFEITYLQPKQTSLDLIRSLVESGQLRALINMHLERETTDFLLQNKIPMACINDDLTRHRIPSVMADTVRGYAEAWRYVRSLGHTRVSYFGYKERNEDRHHECAAGRELARITFPLDLLLLADEVPVSDPGAVATALLENLGAFHPERWPTLFFAQTDQMAVQLMAGLKVLQISVPEQVSVIGFDDTLLARNSHPRLTTLAKPRRQMAFAAALLLSDLLARRPGATNRLQVFPLELIRRETCVPVRPSSRCGH